MPANPFVEQRKIMKSMLIKMLSENKEVSEDKILAIFCLKTGLREKTAREYLKEIRMALEIEVEQK